MSHAQVWGMLGVCMMQYMGAAMMYAMMSMMGNDGRAQAHAAARRAGY